MGNSHLSKIDIPGAPVVPVDSRFTRKLGFYHDEPCGILGHGTVTAIQEFLRSQGTYRYQITGSLDSGTKSAMNEFLYNNQHPTSSYRRRHSNLWTHSTTKALRKYLYDINTQIELTGDAWGVPYKYGRWDSKTTQLLQQYLLDHLPGSKLDDAKPVVIALTPLIQT